MKFDAFKQSVSEDRMENGAWLHFKNSITGEPLYLDPETKLLPTRALVRSSRSKAFRSKHEALLNRFDAKTARARPREAAAIRAVEGHLERGRKLAVVVVQWDNVDLEKPGIQPGPTEDEALVLDQETTMQDYIDQIFAFAAEDENYGGKALVDAGDPSSGNGKAGSKIENV